MLFLDQKKAAICRQRGKPCHPGNLVLTNIHRNPVSDGMKPAAQVLNPIYLQETSDK